MKFRQSPGGLAVLLMAAGCLVFTPGLSAQGQPMAPQSAQQGKAQQPSHQQPSKTYSGTVMKLQNGQYALVIGKTPKGQLAGHFLDDQTDAKKYAGKKVLVTGTLDPSSNTIHVTKIAAA